MVPDNIHTLPQRVIVDSEAGEWRLKGKYEPKPEFPEGCSNQKHHLRGKYGHFLEQQGNFENLHEQKFRLLFLLHCTTKTEAEALKIS